MAKPPFPGVVLERKQSPIDGSPIVAVLTFHSSNRKTGDIPQVWILRADQHPAEALATGADAAICGNCPHRPKFIDGTRFAERSCYVTLQPIGAVWRSFQAGRYPELSPETLPVVAEQLQGRPVRFGAYGDPATMSPAIVALVASLASGHRGYTHQWREGWASWARSWFMASCDGLMDYVDASGAGWRTFRVARANDGPGKLCPATVEGSHATCATCTQCDAKHGHIRVVAHGSGAKHARVD